MAIRIKKGGWTAIGAVAIVLGGFGVMKINKDHPEWFSRAKGVESAVADKVTLQKLAGGKDTLVVSRPVYAVTDVQRENTGVLRLQGISWNAQIGAIYANGGVQTQPDSLLAKNGISLNYSRQDSYDAQAAALLALAQEYAQGVKDPKSGNHFGIIMGDAGPSFLYGLQKQLDEAGTGLHAKIIGATGFSRGEDKCMGLPEWVDDPKKAKGALIAGVVRDGDWNICVMWATLNGLKINPDYRTYDPDAINFLNTTDFIEANRAWLSNKDPKQGTCEERPVVGGIGKKKVCVNGVATWTPGDFQIVEEKGGLLNLMTTADNPTQMAATIITISEWAHDNPATVTNFLQAVLNGGVEVANDRAKLRHAAGLSARVWNEGDASYWFRAYNGTEEDDPISGRPVKLGGSQAIGLATNLQYFTPGAGGRSIYDSVYSQFCGIYTRFYPSDIPSCPKNVVDTFFLEQIAAKAGNVGQGGLGGTFTGSESRVVAAQSRTDITFKVGSAELTESAKQVLNSVRDQLTVSSNLGVVVEGYTSSDGSASANLALSKARAATVANYLRSQGDARLFPANRLRHDGYGSQQLVTDGAGREDAIASRRVVIKLVSAS